MRPQSSKNNQRGYGPDWQYEDRALAQGYQRIVGVDEAGRGPLAGPVVAAAVIIRTRQFSSVIQDSKKLTAQQRECAFAEIMDKAYFGIGLISPAVIDEINILRATFWAMTNAIEQVIVQMEKVEAQEISASRVCLLIDGNRFQSDLPYAVRTIVRGDEQAFSIACASIVAKVTRDRVLGYYDKIFPQYGFSRHKGYPTLEHRQAIKEFGLTMIHRKTFAVK
ncbi:MAG: ribonuclease HII [Candidatus Omnitrophica bacterium]|nr:ribonuclease HII [Candidatus Omnitrophota bacterium]